MQRIESVPSCSALNAEQKDKGTKDTGTNEVPVNYIAVRVTHDNDDLVFEVFRNMPCVIAREYSSKGVKHFHVVIEGHVHYDLIGKRLQRAKLGRAMYWRKKNHMNDFLKAISYTVKSGDYYTRLGFNKWIDLAPEWLPKEEYFAEEETIVDEDKKDTAKQWMFTYSNILKVAFNFRKRRQLKTDKLGDVLSEMTRENKWIPSPQMVSKGLEVWYHRQFEWMCSTQEAPPPEWWNVRY